MGRRKKIEQTRRRLKPRPVKKENPAEIIAEGARVLVQDAILNTLAATLPRSPGLQSALDHVDRFLKEAQARGIVPGDPGERPPVIQLTKQEDGSYK